ncbi:MAG: hypothetical protein EON85_01210 [Brevundimonas sp.]|nr:MAG: hypothetical protein EON85_01210 [Brevundimonas sp.]
MNLFGRELGAEQIASLVFMLMALGLWLMVLRRDRDWTRWFRNWEADRKARREAELAQEGGDASSSDGPRGPWG